MTRIWGAFARIPVPVIVALLVVGGALIPVHEAVVESLYGDGRQEWPQWLGRVTVLWYWAFLPTAVLALWARRRMHQGSTGHVGAWLNFIGGPLQYAVVTLGAVFQGLLGRGDLPTGFMAVEWLGYLIMPGIVLAGIAMLRDPGLPRWQGALVVILAPAAWLPFGGLAVGAALAGLLLTAGRRHPSLDSAVPAPSP
ncbi:hypothetical protein [Blastococcus mobilis]|uniref:Uncharacterized protein n=1 Tax=Blastococcus mobilis TaxID=1938746 RepID=A0A238ZAP3_9ACTN|nr:hypothetical protein [Blastococcus mobilis]SNR79991.1 hypothetical protein SAMN06272737_12642 [Blastococcus mobilis]